MAPTTTRSKNLVRACRYSRIRPAAGSWPAATSAASLSSAAVSPYGAGSLVNPRRYAATRWAVIDGPPLARLGPCVTGPFWHAPPTGSRAPRRGVWQFGYMTTDPAHRSVRLERLENSRYTAINERGGTISVGTGDGTDFTPVELLLVAIGGCTAVDVDILTSRRAEPDSFEIVVEADKVRDTAGNHLTGLQVTFRIAFPVGEQGDKARELLPDAVRKSHDRLCSVSRTVELGTPIATRIE